MRLTNILMGMILSLLCLVAFPAHADQGESQPVTVEYYYKCLPGGTGDWLALYKKNYSPVVKELLKQGILKSQTLYTRRVCALSPAWDFKHVMVWRDWAALNEAHHHMGEIIKRLSPNQTQYDQEEKQRWQLTTAHWDDVLQEVPLD